SPYGLKPTDFFLFFGSRNDRLGVLASQLRISILYPRLNVPRSILPVLTVPRPLIERTCSAA
ncbi:hypothetical protein PFISCL1PPCAC_1119, partial [Pristionchus fissidentatus]